MRRKLTQLPPLSIFLFFTLIWTACTTENEPTPELNGKAYFPLVVGKTLAYDLDSMTYTRTSTNQVKIDTNRWQIRETIVDTFKNSLGETVFRIERSEKRRGATETFKVKSVFSTVFTNGYFLRTEQNLRFIKLPSTFIQNTTWDGNALNDPSVKLDVIGEVLEPFSKRWTSEVKTLDKAEKIGTFDFKEVATVQATTDPKIFTELRAYTEKYAKGIGLVFREFKVLDTQKIGPDFANVAWEKKAEKGFIVRMTVTGY
jgi:hypothetical protein